MGFGGYIPCEPDRGFERVARELAEEEIKEKIVSENPTIKESEMMGMIDSSWDVQNVACFAAAELAGAYRDGRRDSTKRLSVILKRISKRLGKVFLYEDSTFVLYEALKKFPNSPLDFNIRKQGFGDEFYKAVREKTDWVAQELEYSEKIPESRQKDLADFCSEFYYVSKRGSSMNACLVA